MTKSHEDSDCIGMLTVIFLDIIIRGGIRLKINYTLTDDDYVRFNVHYSTHAKPLRGDQVFFRFIAPLILAFILVHGAGWAGWAFGVGALVYVVWAATWPTVHRLTIQRIIRRMMKSGRNKEFTGDFSLELADDCLRETGNGRTTEIAYDRVEKIVHDDPLHYVYIGSVSACIVPDNAFANEEEQKAFFDALEEKTQNRST